MRTWVIVAALSILAGLADEASAAPLETTPANFGFDSGGWNTIFEGTFTSPIAIQISDFNAFGDIFRIDIDATAGAFDSTLILGERINPENGMMEMFSTSPSPLPLPLLGSGGGRHALVVNITPVDPVLGVTLRVTGVGVSSEMTGTGDSIGDLASGTDDQRIGGIVVTDAVPVPEPAAWSLLALGSLAVVRRRRR